MELKAKYAVGDLVTHKLGFKACVHKVVTELRDQNSPMVVQLDEALYVVGYMLNDGRMAVETVPESVVE